MDEINTKIIKYYAKKAALLKNESKTERTPLTFERMQYNRQKGNDGYIGLAKTFNSFYAGEKVGYGRDKSDIESNINAYKLIQQEFEKDHFDSEVLKILSEVWRKNGLQDELKEFVLHPGINEKLAQPSQQWHLLISFYCYNEVCSEEKNFFKGNFTCRELWIWLIEISRNDILSYNESLESEFEREKIEVLLNCKEQGGVNEQIKRYKAIFNSFFNEYTFEE